MLSDFKHYRQALGINMLWNGYAIVIFIRDGLGINPLGSFMTPSFWLLGLLLLFPMNIFQRIYSPNKTLVFFWGSFAVISVAYMLYYPSIGYNFRTDFSREILTYAFPTAFLFGMLYYPDEKGEVLLKVTAIFALIGSLGLLYVILRDPTWNIGQRAAIKFVAFAPSHEGNPHTFANNAVRGAIASSICAYMSKQLWQKFFFICCTIFSVVIILLTRTNTSILSLGIAFGIFTLFHSRKLLAATFSQYALSFFIFFLGIVAFASAQFTSILYVIENTWHIVYKRIINTVYTTSNINIGGDDGATTATIDYSSINRIISYQYFKENFLGSDSISIILFGEGYKSVFLDIPVIEAFINEGILGFLFFGGFSFMLLFFAVREIFQPSTLWNSFLAYLSFLFLIGLVTGGRPVDAGNWMIYMVYLRFLGVGHHKLKQL